MDLSKVPTYHAGIAQSKAHRALHVLVTGLLKKYQLSVLQWFILGLVYDAGKRGITISKIALKLDTTKAFVTTHINLLETRGLVIKTIDPNDTRSRIITLSPGARSKVVKIEHELRIGMRSSIYKSIEPQELGVYIKVLSQLSNVQG